MGSLLIKSYSRPEWYDRNPLSISNTYTALGVAPAGVTTRWTYLVPANRKFFCTSLQSSVLRNSAGAANANVQAWVDEVLGANIFAEAHIITNVAGDRADQQRSHTALILEANSLRGRTFDQSTGGSIDYSLSILGIEYDV